MSEPKVHNKYHKTAPSDAVYIGRGSIYGNPFVLNVHGDRDEVCDMYEEKIMNDPKMIETIKRELKGKHPLCFCKPKRCHGDFLLKLANEV